MVKPHEHVSTWHYDGRKYELPKLSPLPQFPATTLIVVRISTNKCTPISVVYVTLINVLPDDGPVRSETCMS